MPDKEFEEIKSKAGKENAVPEETEVKKDGRGKKKKTKADFSVEEIQEKLSSLFNAFAVFMKIDKDYQPKDFLEESKDIIRLSQKYNGIAMILTLLDPVFLVLSMSKKVLEMMKLLRKRKQKEMEEYEAHETR